MRDCSPSSSRASVEHPEPGKEMSAYPGRGTVTRKRERRVLIVGWDGVRFDLIRQLQPPSLSALTQNGFLRETAMPPVTEAETVTAAGWATNLTGCWPAKHGVTSNRPTRHRLQEYPDVFTRMTAVRPSARSLVVASAAMLCRNLGPGPILGPGVSTTIFHDRTADPAGCAACDPRVMRDATRHLSSDEDSYDIAFVYFGGPDEVAHSSGTMAAAYTESILLQDARLGELLGTVRARSSFDEEDWLIVVTTDHGHREEGGHGGPSREERQSFVAMGTLDGATPTTEPEAVENVDIVPTVLDHLGMGVSPAWELDGQTLLPHR